MSVMNPFQKNGATTSIAVTTTASTAAQLANAGVQGFMATWLGSVPCYLEHGSTPGSSGSGMVATVPSTTTPGSMPLLPVSQSSFTIQPGAYLSAISSAAAGGTLLLTPGIGF